MHKVQEGYAEMFKNVPQEVMITLRCEHGSVNAYLAYHKAKEFVRMIAKQYRTQIVGVAVFNNLRHPHIHMLLAGNSVSIRDLTIQTVERLWGYGSSFVKPCWDNGGARYLALNITPHADDKWEEYFFNLRLLKKTGVALPDCHSGTTSPAS